MTIVILFLLCCLSALDIGLVIAVFRLERSLLAAEEKKNGEIAALAENTVKTNERIDELCNAITELEKTPKDEVNDAVEEARAKVLKEYIDAVVNYTPYGGDK